MLVRLSTVSRSLFRSSSWLLTRNPVKACSAFVSSWYGFVRESCLISAARSFATRLRFLAYQKIVSNGSIRLYAGTIRRILPVCWNRRIFSQLSCCSCSRANSRTKLVSTYTSIGLSDGFQRQVSACELVVQSGTDQPVLVLVDQFLRVLGANDLV